MRRVSAKSPPMGGDLSAGGACPSPMRSRWRIAAPFSAVIWLPDDGGDARRRARTAHTARQAERARPEAGRLTAETAATAGRAPRAQPTLANGQRTREVVPLPPLKFPLGCEPQASTTRGRGERPVGAAGEGERPDAKQNASAPPHADQAPRGRQRKRPEASRGRADRTHRDGGKPVTRTRIRARPAAKPTRPTAQRRPAGAGAATPPPHAPARARPRPRTTTRRRGGRRRRRPGGTRTRKQAATHAISAEKRHARTHRPQARPTQSAKGKARPQIRLNCSSCIRWNAGAPARSAARRRANRHGRRSGWADSVSLPSLPRFRGCGGLLCLLRQKNAQKGEKREFRG